MPLRLQQLKKKKVWFGSSKFRILFLKIQNFSELSEHIRHLIRKDITIIKMGSGKSFIYCDKCGFW